MTSAESESGRTSRILRRAIDGDLHSLEWLVEHLSPLLVLQAGHRLGPHLRQLYDAEDIVQDAWLVLLPRLDQLRPRGGRATPVLLRFLSTTILNRVSNLLQKHLRHARSTQERREQASPSSLELATDSTAVLERMARGESYHRILTVLQGLAEEDRLIVLYHGVEQNSCVEVAAQLQIKPNTVVVKYRRALDKLRARLPDSVFDEMGT
jgi:RNA polymerase sigma factor (sigma-70 family)